MEGYRDACPDQVEGFRKEVKWLIVRLMQDLEDQFKEDVKVQLYNCSIRVILGENSILLFIDKFPQKATIFDCGV